MPAPPRSQMRSQQSAFSSVPRPTAGTLRSMWLLEHPRWKVLLAIGLLVLGVSLRDRIRGMDALFFQSSFHGVQGLLLYLAGRYEQAAHAYRAHFRTAGVAGREHLDGLLHGDADAAERAAQAALTHRPNDSDALLTLAEVALERNDPAAALRAAERLLARDPQHFDGLLLASVGLARLARYGEAIDAINEAQATEQVVQRRTVFLAALEVTGWLARLPAGQRPWCLLAHYHRWLRVHDRAQAATALRYADEAIAKGDHPADAYLTKGIVYDLQGRGDRALAAFLKALDINPRHAEVLRWAAIKYEDRGDPVNEYRMAKAAFEVAPDRPRYVQRLGHVVVNKLGDPVQAIALAEAALARTPDNDAALRWLGHAYSLLGEHERAVDAFARSAATRPSVEAWEGAGFSLHELGRLPDAATAYRRALALDPGRSESHRWLAVVYQGMGRFADAVTEYEVAFGGRDVPPGHLIQLCDLYNGIAAYSKAVQCYEAVLRAEPSNFRAQLGLPDALLGLQQTGGGRP